MNIKGKEYKINRETSVVSEWDKIYCNLLKKILKEGELFENRTGIDTLSIEGVAFKLDAGSEFPILESKKVAIKNALSEMLWIYQAQSNDVSWLKERANNIWNEWEVDEDGIYRTYEPKGEYDPDREVTVYDLDGNPKLDEEGNIMTAKSNIEGKTIKTAKYFGPEYAGTIGTAYGWITNKFKRPQYVLHQLKHNPHDRRMVISLWQDEYLRTAVLPSCVWSSEWKVKDGKLHVFVHQRSADTPLGLPFNVSQYAILQAMFAKVSGLEVGNLNWSIMDAHIYVNQIDGIKLELERFKKMQAWEKIIANETDEELEARYLALKERETVLEEKAKTSKQAEKMLNEIKEQIMIFELMITKEKPILELADKDDFFSFDNNVNNDKEYLEKNITGNEDIKVLRYKSAPFIKMPIAQ